LSSSSRHTGFSRDWSSDVCSSDLDDAIHLVHSAPEKISGHCVTSTPDSSLFPGYFPELLPLLLLAALLLDRWLGEPARFHPLVRSEESRGGTAGSRRCGGARGTTT